MFRHLRFLLFLFLIISCKSSTNKIKEKEITVQELIDEAIENSLAPYKFGVIF